MKEIDAIFFKFYSWSFQASGFIIKPKSCQISRIPTSGRKGEKLKMAVTFIILFKGPITTAPATAMFPDCLAVLEEGFSHG